MARFLILLFALLIALSLAQAQPVTGLADRTAYRGNAYSFGIVLTQADSAKTITATMYLDRNQANSFLPIAKQPTVSRSGRTVTIAWSRTQTAELPDRSWMEIKAGNIARFNLFINCNKNAAVIAQPGSLTVISPATDLAGAVLLPGPSTSTYPLQNVIFSGYSISHNKANSLVTASFFRGDTGQIDPLWRIEIQDQNTVIVRGPPGEVFSGQLVLAFPTRVVDN